MAKRRVALKGDDLKTYIFRAVLEEDRWPDEPPSEAVWRAYVPVLESHGVATWGETREEALKNLQEVLEMVIESMIEHGEPIPEGPPSEVEVVYEPRVSIMV
jgi:antitoxin HicB